MAAAVASYCPETFNKLPTLLEAGAKFEENGKSALVMVFQDLFRKHNVDRIFGLRLLHRHFTLEPEERLVEYNSTTTPWSLKYLLDSPHVQGSNWVLAKDGVFRPFEFVYTKGTNGEARHPTPEDAEYSDFMKEFKKVLHENNLTDTLGLCLYPGDDYNTQIEITEGRANINLNFDDAPHESYKKGYEAAWFFSKTLVMRGKCVPICGGNGHEKPSGHVTGR